MKPVAFLFAVAVCILANPAEKNQEVTKEDIEKLLDDFIKQPGVQSTYDPSPSEKDTDLHLKSENANITITALDDVVYGRGKLSYGTKFVELNKNSLEIKAPFVWSGTIIDGNFLIKGTVDGIEINDKSHLKITADNLRVGNHFKFALDENSVKLTDYEIAGVTLDGVQAETTGTESGVVTREQLDNAVRDSFRQDLKEIISKMIAFSKDFLEICKHTLESNNLTQNVEVIKSEFTN